MITKIYIEATDSKKNWFDGFGDDDTDGNHIYLNDDETMSGLLKKLKPYAVEHGVQFIEIQTDMIPDGDF